MTNFTENNFFEMTAALFSICDEPTREPDYVSGSGSAYWYENDGVIRKSDHWGHNVASCKWWLRELDMRYSENVEFIDLLDSFGGSEVCAFSKFADFRNIDEFYAEWNVRKHETAFKVNPLF